MRLGDICKDNEGMGFALYLRRSPLSPVSGFECIYQMGMIAYFLPHEVKL